MPNLPVHIWTFIGFTTFLDDSGRRLAITDLGELQDVLQQFDFYFLWPDCTFLNLLFFLRRLLGTLMLSPTKELPLDFFRAVCSPVLCVEIGTAVSVGARSLFLVGCVMMRSLNSFLKRLLPVCLSGICARRFSPLPTQLC